MNFEREVFPAELRELGRRRAAPIEGESGPDEPPPADAHELVGLCFSGGGIRSSTFNLGVVRGLQRWGLLPLVDYLSTVSGGGYIGSYVANVFRTGDEALLFDDEDGDGRRREARGISQLRMLGRFLTPNQSLGEWLQGLVSLLRGVLWNCSIFTLVAVALAATFAFALDAGGEWVFGFPHTTATLAAVGVSAVVLMLSVVGPSTPSAGLLLSLLGGTLLVALADALPWVLDHVAAHRATLSIAAISSGVSALLGSSVLAKLPAQVYVLVARLIALLLAVVLPTSVFLLVLLELTGGPDPLLLGKQLGAIGLLAVFLFVDFNRTSLHTFYKERIAATFLAGAPPKLSEFRGRPGPLHLINVALNVPADGDLHLRDRRADFFTLSCLHVGGPRTGYVDTTTFEAAQAEFTLANAVAISGAAASPNMGLFTDSLIRPIMTMLNVRMGYWAPNPAELGEPRPAWRYVPRLGSLFAEMRGDLRSDRLRINISDGGHLENLGAFELLRRRCKLIIIGDGGADPKASLGDMATLIRFAQVDLGAEIEIDLDDLRLGDDGLSRKHAALGVVRYADGSVGRILYLKSSLTGNEPPEVRYYKETNPAFPNESTADQWFDDAQFDAYRKLGEEVVDSLFQELGYEHPQDAAISKATLDERLAALEVVLTPASRSRSESLTEQLHAVETALMRPELDAYRRQLIPTVHAKPIPDEQLHTLVSIVMLQLQLMENAVERLGLIDVRMREAPANRGWMNVFDRWAHSAAFRCVALVCLPSFGAGLTHFARVALGLGTIYGWEVFPDKPHTLALLENYPDRKGMIMGLAEYTGTLDAPQVHRLAMRAGLGGRDRVAAAIAALREVYPRVGFAGELAELVAAMPRASYVGRPVTAAWTVDDEQLVVSFTLAHADKPGPMVFSPQPSQDPFAGMMSFEIPRASSKPVDEPEPV